MRLSPFDLALFLMQQGIAIGPHGVEASGCLAGLAECLDTKLVSHDFKIGLAARFAGLAFDEWHCFNAQAIDVACRL
jgi:hypothetical protein